MSNSYGVKKEKQQKESTTLGGPSSGGAFLLVSLFTLDGWSASVVMQSESRRNLRVGAI